MASERLVTESAHFVVSVPFASRAKFRLLIAPKRHHMDFGTLEDDELDDLARVLQHACAVYYHKLADTPFNMAIYTCPVNMEQSEKKLYADSYHWYIGLYPRETSEAGGFEHATDTADNKSLPEDEAQQMRDWLQELQGTHSSL